MNLRDLPIPQRQPLGDHRPGVRALETAATLIRDRIKATQHNSAGVGLYDADAIAEAQALLNLEAELWARANFDDEDSITGAAMVPAGEKL